MMIPHEEPFPAAYEAEVLDDRPGDVDLHIAAPGASSRATAIQVHPHDGGSWSALVSGGAATLRGATSGLFATPNVDVLAVVERGTAFLVDVRKPAEYHLVTTDGPVASVVSARRDGLLLLATPWSITAIGEQGASWRTDRVGIEDLRVDEIDEGWLRGVADPDDDEPREFAVDLATGRLIGGAGL